MLAALGASASQDQSAFPSLGLLSFWYCLPDLVTITNLFFTVNTGTVPQIC